MKNIACNLIYNNGDEGVYVGFNKRCDIQNIIYNVNIDKGRWCSQSKCSCRIYHDKGFKGRLDDYPCNESKLFKDWEWNPGNEFKTEKPFRILNTGAKKYAILTTRFPYRPESERKIVGFMKIKKITDNYYRIIADEKFSLRMTLDEAHELNFWNYHRNEKNNIPMWRQGRFRYLENNQVAAILFDLKNVVQNESTQSMIIELLKNDFPDYTDKRPDVKGALKESYIKNLLLKRKYGKGGESKEHKRLKEYIANHPEEIGITDYKVKPIVEHSYVSGDMVDILFEPIEGIINMVVEIELDNVLPGIHQAIKYRALRCSQLGRSLTDENVKATVVAWKFKQSEIELCTKYNINFIEKKI